MAPGRESAKRILFVEDDADVRETVALVLAQEGYVVRTAENGQEALDTYERNRGKMALVLMDVQMPKMDGVQALAALRQADPNVRVALMNDTSGRHTNEALQELGAVQVFQKPFMKFAEVA